MTEKLIQCPVCEQPDFSHFLAVKDYFLTAEEFTIQKCDHCGFKFVNPRPDKSEIGRYYQSEEYISHDAKKVNLLGQVYKMARIFSINNKYKLVKKYVKSGKILDIGCGTGEFLQYCKSKGFEVKGVEPNEKAGDFAKLENGIPVSNDLSDLAMDKDSYGCITMWHVLEHIHDLNETLDLVKGLLEPKGIFIVAVPNSNSWDAQEYGKFWAAYDVPRHLYHFTDVTLEKLVTRHGFEVKERLPQKLDSFYVSMLSEKYRSGRSN